MKKNLIIVMAVLILSSTALFAAAGDSAYFYADKAADSTESYMALKRDAAATYTNRAGEVVETAEASAEYELANYGNLIERYIKGDKNIFTLLDNYYDGYVLTPFNDDIVEVSKTYKGTEDVDGTLCNVYSVDISLYENLFFFDAADKGELLGWDSEEKEPDGDMNITIYTDCSDNTLVKQVNTYEDLGISQVITYSKFNVDGKSVSLPSTVTTTGVIKEKAGEASIYDTQRFSITETFSDYVYNKNYTHEF